MKVNEAIILAGGFGKRLRSVVRDVPKPMADIAGRPFLAYLLDYLYGQGISRVLLSVGYRRQVIIKYFGLKYNKTSIYYVAEHESLGTGGAIREAFDCCTGEDVVVLNGDTLFALDLRQMVDFHLSRKSALTIALKPMRNAERYGTADVKGDRITGFREKAAVEAGLINGGVYVMNKSIRRALETYGRNFSFEVDFLQAGGGEDSALAFVSAAYFIDIGIPEDYERARRELGSAVGGLG